MISMVMFVLFLGES